MNYYEMTTEQLETLKSSIEEKLSDYVGMSFQSLRSENVTYEINSIDPDEVLITANHFFNGLIRDYTVTINDDINDDVEYNRYNADEEIIDGGYISFDRLQKDVRNAVVEICTLYKDLEKIESILDTRTEEETEEETEEKNLTNLAMILIPKSSNEKTGDIIQSYSARSTCPNRCPLKNNGCYANSYHTSRQWDRCNDEGDKRYIRNGHGLTLDLISAVAIHAKKGEKSTLFRHNVAGDIALPDSDLIDDERLNTIAESCNKASSILNVNLMGYTYTHCSLTMQNFKKVKKAQAKGFTVNFSCETIEEVKEVKRMNCNAVITSVNPDETIKSLKAEGLKSVQCPAQTNEAMNCKRCKLCACNREAVVIFAIHGNGSNKARKIIMLKNEKVA